MVIERGSDSDNAVAASTAILPTMAVKRSVTIAGHATSIALEAAFWTCLEEAAGVSGASMPQWIAAVDAERGSANLSSALRVSLLAWSRAREFSTPRPSLDVFSDQAECSSDR